jgi:hypothetical protein
MSEPRVFESPADKEGSVLLLEASRYGALAYVENRSEGSSVRVCLTANDLDDLAVVAMKLARASRA